MQWRPSVIYSNLQCVHKNQCIIWWQGSMFASLSMQPDTQQLYTNYVDRQRKQQRCSELLFCRHSALKPHMQHRHGPISLNQSWVMHNRWVHNWIIQICFYGFVFGKHCQNVFSFFCLELMQPRYLSPWSWSYLYLMVPDCIFQTRYGIESVRSGMQNVTLKWVQKGMNTFDF